MVNLADLLIYLLFIISTLISVFIFQKIIARKSFYKTYSRISTSVKQNEIIYMIKNLQDYLNNYSEEQILFDNLNFCKKEIVFWYNIFFVSSFTLIFFLVFYSNLPDEVKWLLILITNTIIISLIMILYSFICKRLRICHIRRKSLARILWNIAIKNSIIIIVSITIFLIFIAVFSLFLSTLIDENSTIQLFSTTISEISTYRIESINGNRFSLSALFFTLAIGGTVVFSITSSHLKQKEKINEELSKQINMYEKWFEENKQFLSVKLKNIFDKDTLIAFYNAVDVLSIKLNVKDFRKLKDPVQRYYSIITVIIVSYFMAILTVIAPSNFMNFLFFIFVVCCGLFIFYTYKIFNDYSR